MNIINDYSLYSYNANDFQSLCDDKVLVDLQKLKSIDEYNDVKQYIEKTFGKIEVQKILEYPNNIKVIIVQEEDLIIVAAMQNDEQIFGLNWKLTNNAE